MKKLLTMLSILTLVITVAVCFNANAAEERVVIDNVVYELTSQKYGTLDYGEHYAVTDFFEDETLAETTTKINIVDEIDGIEVKAINANFNADQNNDRPYSLYDQKYPGVKKINIPATVKYLGDYTFNFFTGVEQLYLPAELEEMGYGVFSTMESLKSITLPAGITYIDEDAFYKCTSLEKVVVNGDITGVDHMAFYGCEKLASFNFPDTIKYLGNSSFSKTAITKAIIPENVDGDEGGVFADCNKLVKVVFEDTSDEKEDYVTLDYEDFYRCSSVKAIYIKTIPTKGINFNKTISMMPQLADVYFAGSEKKWIELVDEDERAELEAKGVTIHFYYRHTHSFTRNGNPTCTKGGKFTYSCECGDTQTVTLAKDTNNHSYGSWKVTKKATYAAAGTKQRTCKYCKKIQKATVKKLILGEIENLTATVNGNDVVLNWDALEGATGYRVYMFDKEKNKNVKLASIKGKITYTVSDLEAGETYYFIIKPYNKTSSGTVTWGGLYRTSAEIPAAEEAA